MSLGLKVVKGMKDILPDEIPGWYFVEEHLKSIALAYGYQEIRMPILEQTELFKRAIGEVTDIVEKEMYTFTDKGGESLTMRPEGTAQSVRLALENSLLRNQSQRLWYMGPMFRRENPQKGRYRQFYQFGIEAFGLEGPDVDVEQILMMARLWRNVGLSDKIVLKLNSLGTIQERAKYREALIEYYKKFARDIGAKDKKLMLDEDSQRRLLTNPMRILDSKNPEVIEINKDAPILLDFLGTESKHHFETIQAMLKDLGVAFEVDSRIVRGLDYYTHTVYEWVTTHLGSQGTVCAGGRYNGLVSLMGGPETPSVGFALGMERLLMLLQDNQLIPAKSVIDIYIVGVGEKGERKAMSFAEEIRQQFPTLHVLNNCGGGSFKSQFKRADKSGAKFAFILGDDEVANNQVTIKSLREEIPQQTKSQEEALAFLKDCFI
ncbi:MAG: histidine--tRNA ligase [Gammaproteobacteria bacterium]|jgi:histidyl-tRNA synthetase|nr:histidine--tRNA ligase [Gammaproteobacteria bacterium]